VIGATVKGKPLKEKNMKWINIIDPSKKKPQFKIIGFDLN
tara:strand:+ start:3914 stop:4033 length:120 start_codon:yes stop_codon:yes gene_type:complete